MFRTFVIWFWLEFLILFFLYSFGLSVRCLFHLFVQNVITIDRSHKTHKTHSQSDLTTDSMNRPMWETCRYIYITNNSQESQTLYKYSIVVIYHNFEVFYFSFMTFTLLKKNRTFFYVKKFNTLIIYRIFIEVGLFFSESQEKRSFQDQKTDNIANTTATITTTIPPSSRDPDSRENQAI